MYHTKEDQRSIQSKHMLYRALSNRMRDKDFPSITIKEVVNEAQMGRSTFYRNFRNLESVLIWKCDDVFEELYRYILQSMDPGAIGDRSPFVLPFFRYWHADSEIVERLVTANRTDILFSAFDESMKRLIALFNPAIVDGSSHFEYFLAFRSGAMIRILLQWIKRGKDLSPEELCRLIEAQGEGFMRKAGFDQ